MFFLINYTNTASSKYFPVFYVFLLDDLAFKHKMKILLVNINSKNTDNFFLRKLIRLNLEMLYFVYQIPS